MTQVIYKIINLVNDKFYVGSTSNQRERFRTHRNKLRRGVHHCLHLQAAWNKYGEEKFAFKVVAQIPDEESLQEAEDLWLVQHVGKPYCYNAGLRSGAPMRGIQKERHPNFGRPVSEEQKQQISQTLKDFYAEDYFNHPRVGKQHTEETKAKISASKKANPVAYWEGKERSQETRQKIGDAQRGKPKGPGRKVSEEGRAKIQAAAAAGHYGHWAGRAHTEESKEKMRRPVYAILPDGSRQDFPGTALAGETLGVPYQMLVRTMKAQKPITKGKLAGWLFCYADAPVEPPTPVEIPEEFKHLPRTRQGAKDKGEKHYFTGEPCKHGHIAPRLTKGACTACRKAGLA
jgi:group I intron endonuclease